MESKLTKISLVDFLTFCSFQWVFVHYNLITVSLKWPKPVVHNLFLLREPQKLKKFSRTSKVSINAMGDP